nr:MAG TPA: hypothetical protein [Caudoviricetes sp.]
MQCGYRFGGSDTVIKAISESPIAPILSQTYARTLEAESISLLNRAGGIPPAGLSRFLTEHF